MLSLNFLTKQRFPVVLETKSLLSVIRGLPNGIFKFKETANQNVYRRNIYRPFSSNKHKDEVIKSQSSGGDLTSGIETVKETTKTVTYSGIIVIGLGLSGVIFYSLFHELFSGNSVNSIYSKTLERCLKNDKVLLSLGEPIKAFDDENPRGRRRHINHLLYKKDEINYMRMKFYIKGSRKKATVHLEMKENESKNFDYRYLFVQLDEYPYTTIVLEDNRTEKASVIQPTQETMELT